MWGWSGVVAAHVDSAHRVPPSTLATVPPTHLCAKLRPAGKNVEPGRLAEKRALWLRNLLVRVEPGPGGGPAEGDLGDLWERVPNSALAEADLGGVARELLAERDRNRIHQVGAAGFDDVLELVSLGRQGLFELVERGQKVI